VGRRAEKAWRVSREGVPSIPLKGDEVAKGRKETLTSMLRMKRIRERFGFVRIKESERDQWLLSWVSCASM